MEQMRSLSLRVSSYRIPYFARCCFNVNSDGKEKLYPLAYKFCSIGKRSFVKLLLIDGRVAEVENLANAVSSTWLDIPVASIASCPLSQPGSHSSEPTTCFVTT